jgi:DNA-binding transcriptional LysR family regulator
MLHVPSGKNANILGGKPADIGFANMSAYKDIPFIALSPQQRMHKLLIKICNDNGFQPKIIFETKSVETAFSMVLNGVGVTILPDTLLRFGNFARHPEFFRIDHRLATRQIGVIYKKRRYLSQAAGLFIELLENWGRLARQMTSLNTDCTDETSHP